jgi:hypothetical protein
LTETREALEQQTATSEILRVISNSPADLQPTFDAIAAAARTLTGAALGSVVTYDGKLMHVAALAGFTLAETEEIQRLFPIPADHGTATGRAILTAQAAHIGDLAADPEHAYQTLAQSSGQTVLAVPMLRDGVPTGAINDTNEPRGAPHRACAFSNIASKTGATSPGELLMTCNTSAVAVCCSSASRVTVSSRAFSIAMTACAAKFCNSAICLSENGRTSRRYTVMSPSRTPSLRRGTVKVVRIPAILTCSRNSCPNPRPWSCSVSSWWT